MASYLVTALDRFSLPLLRRVSRPGVPWVALSMAAIGHLLLLLPLSLSWHGAASLLVLALLPGVLLADLLLPGNSDLPERAGLSVALGLAFLALLMLGLHAIPGPLPGALLLGVADAVSLGLLVQKARMVGIAPSPLLRPQSSIFNLQSSILLVILALALFLRLPNLGYGEFQGDEARAALLAAGVVHGNDSILLIHQKGPVEVLLPAASYALLGSLNEFNARLPFAIANLAALLLVYSLGRRLFGAGIGRLAGTLAAVVLALSGYQIAFSRILQYQSVVMLYQVAAVWCCWGTTKGADLQNRRIGQELRGSAVLEETNDNSIGANGRLYRVRMIMAAVFCAVGILAHYEGVLVLPVLLLLFAIEARRRGLSFGAQVRTLALPGLLLVLLPASFFVPFVLAPSFAITQTYVLRRVGQQEGAEFLYNNIGFYFNLSSFYSSIYQVVALVTALVAGMLAWLHAYVRPRLLSWLLATLFLVGLAIGYRAPLLLVVNLAGFSVNLGFVLVLPALVALIVARATPLPLRALLLWFTATFAVAAFLVRKPGTHFYTCEPAWALLAGAACAQWIYPRWFGWNMWRRRLLQGAATTLLALSVYYIAIVYVRVSPEYKRVFPAARPAIYWAPFGDELPNGGYFGFPYRAGWKAIGYLYERGLLSGTYDSNEEDLISGWYMRGAPRCDWRPSYYFVAEQVQDAHWIPLDLIHQEYRQIGTVKVRGGEKITIYSRERDRSLRYLLPPELETSGAVTPSATDFSQGLVAERLEEQFDRLTMPDFPLGPSLGPGLFQAVPGQRLDIAFAGGVRLVGYDLYASAGRSRYLTLYWLGDRPLPPSYEVRVGLEDASGTPLAPASLPCGDRPPTTWQGKTYIAVLYELPEEAVNARISIVDSAGGTALPVGDGRNAVELDIE